MKNNNPRIERMTATASFPCAPPRSLSGFTLVEMMIAMTLSLGLIITVTSVYLSSKTAFRRQDQLNTMQQNIRLAFDFLSTDTRTVGHMGCFTGRSSGFSVNNLSASDLRTNYGVPVEGYSYSITGNAYTIASNYPANKVTADVGEWATNTAAGGIATLPFARLGDSNTVNGSPAGATPGSDVLVLRTIGGKSVRLRTPIAAAATSMDIDYFPGGKCSNGNAVGSGFCAKSQGLIASCTAATLFSASAAASSATSTTLTLANNLGSAFAQVGTEVFPMQTIVYYVKRSSNGTSPALYRRVFDGNDIAGNSTTNEGVEQELIEGVESLQVRYGLDTTATPDGVVDIYSKASDVTDWSTVVSLRVSLLMRSPDAVAPDVAVPTSGVMSGVTFTYPSGAGVAKYDRRVFTTTIAVRNKIAHLPEVAP